MASRKTKVKTLLPNIADRDIKTLNEKHLFTAGKGTPLLSKINADEEEKVGKMAAKNDEAKNVTRFLVEN